MDSSGRKSLSICEDRSLELDELLISWDLLSFFNLILDGENGVGRLLLEFDGLLATLRSSWYIHGDLDGCVHKLQG
jgi:hypothetical protein